MDKIPAHSILQDPKYFSFGNVIGGGDGTYIEVLVPSHEQGRFRCRKGFTAQNVFAVADFDMNFWFVQAGCEGSANDSQILNYLIDHGMFQMPQDKVQLPHFLFFELLYICLRFSFWMPVMASPKTF